MKKLLALSALCLVLISVAWANPVEYVSVYAEELSTLNCLKSSLTALMYMGYNTQDGLVECDQYGVLRPSLATDWTLSEDGKVVTFHVRKGVKWYDHEGEEYADLTAHDFVTSMKWVLTKSNASACANTVYNNIAGAKDYYTGKTTDFSTVGVKALDDYTVQYTMLNALPYTLRLFSFTAFYPVCGKCLEECGESYGTSNDTIVYCGPYILKEFEPEYQHVLERNTHYWNNEAMHIDVIIEKYNKEASANGPELFLRKEIMDLEMPAAILDEWMNDPAKKKLLHPHHLTNMTYFMAFNFEPKYEAEYAPEDWVVAVNNLNFRKSFYYGFNRMAALKTVAPYDAERRVLNTLTRRNLVQWEGVDYTMMGGLAAYTTGNFFDPEKALDYKAKAMAELQGNVKFPLKVIMPYNVGKVDFVNRAQVVEQQMEGLLGKDYIDIILVPYAASGYNVASRNSGKFSFSELGWGPDFVDPMSSFDPVTTSGISKKYGRIHLAKDYLQPSGKGKFEEMVDKANAEVKDIKKRYELFAEAEVFLLDNAFVVPYYQSGGGFVASYIDPFTSFTGQLGINARKKLKGSVILDKPMDMEAYEVAKKKYDAARLEALKSSKY